MFYKLDENNNPQQIESKDSIGDIQTLFRDEIDGVLVSTIFLGLDRSFGKGQPVLFETIVFSNNPDFDQYQTRYYTYEEAKTGHELVCNAVKTNTSLMRKLIKLNFKCGDL